MFQRPRYGRTRRCDPPVANVPRLHRSSRTDARAAGWYRDGEPPGSYVRRLERRVDPRYLHFFWFRPRTLLQARNDRLARRATEMVDNERARWRAAQRAAGVEERFPDLVIDRRDLLTPSFLVLGDTGEADASQYAVVEPLLAAGADTDFMVLASDVIYPAGDVNDYVNGFFIPYEDYRAPIYALPGNHDWYALLNGFMYHFCGAEALPRTDYHPLSYPPAERRARRKWRQSSQPRRDLLFAYRRWRDAPHQPGPYWALDTAAVRLVAIDVGVGDRIDAEQGAWLEHVSRAPMPKIMLSGKPIYVNGCYQAGGIAGSGRTIDDVVRDPLHGYVAHIAGDVHNYQRYPVDLGDGRTIQYIVAGGGGAFMNETHSIAPVALPGVDEEAVRLYPLRGDSLARYSRVLAPRLRRAVGLLVAAVALAALFAGGIWMEVRPRWAAAALEVLPGVVGLPALVLIAYMLATYGWIVVLGGAIDPADAQRYVGGLLGIEPRRAGSRDRPLGFVVRRRLRAMLPAAGRERLLFRGKAFSAFFDFDEPPFFKSFLRLDVSARSIRVSCFGVTGWRGDETEPAVEDELEIPLV